VRQKFKTHVVLSGHAIKRWRERVGTDKVITMQRFIRNAIYAATKSGMKLENGSATVKVFRNISAVVAPSFQGGWEVITILSEPDDINAGEKVANGIEKEDGIPSA
jgi:hypothetical protein